MKLATPLILLLTTLILGACGGGDSGSAGKPESAPAPQLLAATSVGSVTTFSGNRSNYTIVKTANGVTVTDNVGPDGVVTLSNPSRLVFADAGIAYDLSGIAGKAFRIYQAAFNRTPDLGGLGYWIEQMDKGQSLETVAGLFVTSAEFASQYGANPSNRDIIGKFYQNVLHRAPDQAGYDYWVNVLDTKGATVANVLAGFGESPENQSLVAGYIANGINYALYKPSSAAGALDLAKFTACPEASNSKSKDAFSCMVGSATGQTTFGGAACTLTITDTGTITLASGSNKQVVQVPYYSVLYTKLVYNAADNFFLLGSFTSTAYVGGLSIPVAGNNIQVKVTSPKFAAMGGSAAGIQADINDLSCKFAL